MCLLVLASSAHAADADGFSLSGSAPWGEGTARVEAPSVPGDGAALSLTTVRADHPVDLGERGVESLTGLALAGSWSVEDRARLDLWLPTYLRVRASASGYDGAALGDVVLGATVPLWAGRPVELAVAPRLVLPTGSTRAYTRGGPAGGLALLAGGTRADFGWLANAGLVGAPAERVGQTRVGSRVDVRVGGWWRIDRGLRVGADVDGQLALVTGPSGRHGVSRALGFFQGSLASGVSLLVGAGAALTGTVAAPTFQTVAALSWAPRRELPSPEPVAQPTPPQAPPPRPRPWPGPLAGPDSDQDGIPDQADHCPHQPRPASELIELSNGCPRPAWVTAERVELERGDIAFDHDGAVLLPTSRVFLDQIAQLLQATPRVALVEVVAHLDDRGDDASSLALTAERARMVRDYLLARGVDPGRVVSRGAGSAHPIDTNRTESGRARNQRVEVLVRSLRPAR